MVLVGEVLFVVVDVGVADDGVVGFGQCGGFAALDDLGGSVG